MGEHDVVTPVKVKIGQLACSPHNRLVVGSIPTGPTFSEVGYEKEWRERTVGQGTKTACRL